MGANTPYSEPELARMRTLCEAGKTTTDVIDTLYREFGIMRSRTSIGYKRREMGVDAPPNPAISAHSIKGRRDAGRDAARRRFSEDGDDLPGLSVMEIRDGKCRYAIHDEPYRFCGEPTIEGSQYCAKHHAICHDRTETERNKKRIGRLANRSASIQ